MNDGSTIQPRRASARTTLSALTIAIAITAVSLASAQFSTDRDLLVPANETLVVGSALHVKTLTVLGTLTSSGPGGLDIHADVVHVGDGGVLAGARGLRGADVRAFDAV